VRQVNIWLRDEGIELPVKSRKGEAQGIVWKLPTLAYCSRRYSRRNRQATLRQGNLQCQHRSSGRSQRAIGI
jgi:hypothetical protein